MDIKDFSQIRALYTLLSNIKYSEGNDHILKYVSTQKLDEILKSLREAFYNEILKERGLSAAKRWMWDTSFSMNSEEGKQLKEKIDNWPQSVCLLYREYSEDQLKELAYSLVFPFDDNRDEVEVLLEYIKQRIANEL